MVDMRAKVDLRSWSISQFKNARGDKKERGREMEAEAGNINNVDYILG